MDRFNYHSHHPVTSEFEAGGRVYRKISESDTHYFFSVSPETGTDFYEIFEKRCYTTNRKTFLSSTLSEGDHMYPVDRDFGVWAWCYSDYGYAIEKWNEKNDIKN